MRKEISVPRVSNYHGPANVTLPDGTTAKLTCRFTAVEPNHALGEPGLNRWGGVIHADADLSDLLGEVAAIEMPDGRTGQLLITSYAGDTADVTGSGPVPF
jgi:hypothetical protein